jgi:hypothetical protein
LWNSGVLANRHGELSGGGQLAIIHREFDHRGADVIGLWRNRHGPAKATAAEYDIRSRNPTRIQRPGLYDKVSRGRLGVTDREADGGNDSSWHRSLRRDPRNGRGSILPSGSGYKADIGEQQGSGQCNAK